MIPNDHVLVIVRSFRAHGQAAASMILWVMSRMFYWLIMLDWSFLASVITKDHYWLIVPPCASARGSEKRNDWLFIRMMVSQHRQYQVPKPCIAEVPTTGTHPTGTHSTNVRRSNYPYGTARNPYHSCCARQKCLKNMRIGYVAMGVTHVSLQTCNLIAPSNWWQRSHPSRLILESMSQLIQSFKCFKKLPIGIQKHIFQWFQWIVKNLPMDTESIFQVIFESFQSFKN